MGALAGAVLLSGVIVPTASAEVVEGTDQTGEASASDLRGDIVKFKVNNDSLVTLSLTTVDYIPWYQWPGTVEWDVAVGDGDAPDYRVAVRVEATPNYYDSRAVVQIRNAGTNAVIPCEGAQANNSAVDPPVPDRPLYSQGSRIDIIFRAVCLPGVAGQPIHARARLTYSTSYDDTTYSPVAQYGPYVAPVLPGVPTSVSASRGEEQATIVWGPPAGSAEVTGYRVSRNGTDTGGYGVFTKDLPATDRSFTFLSLRPVEYTLTVQAIGKDGSVGPQGVAFATPTAPTVLPPVQPDPPPPPPPPPGTGRFADDNGDVHEANIEFIVAAGITQGCSPADSRLYCPYTSVTRGQMATFLSRAAGLPASGTDHFGDDGGDVHEDNINRVAAAGLTNGWVSDGCGDGRYCPTKPLTRAEMATMVARAFGVPAVDGGSFSDLDAMGVHAPSINALAGAGVVRGCGDSRYCPGGLTTRAAMATILANAIRLP